MTRRILPLLIADGYLQARDIATDTTKTFALRKIELVEDGAPVDYHPLPKTDDSDFREIFKNEVAALAALGWRVVLTQETIKLYATNSEEPLVGVKRNYDVTLSISLDGSDVEQHVSLDRPWYVFDPDYMRCLAEPEGPEDGRSYKHLNHAKKIFFEQARKHAPDRSERK